MFCTSHFIILSFTLRAYERFLFSFPFVKIKIYVNGYYNLLFCRDRAWKHKIAYQFEFRWHCKFYSYPRSSGTFLRFYKVNQGHCDSSIEKDLATEFLQASILHVIKSLYTRIYRYTRENQRALPLESIYNAFFAVLSQFPRLPGKSGSLLEPPSSDGTAWILSGSRSYCYLGAANEFRMALQVITCS